MKFIYYNIKVGIFVKIVNGQIYQFTPIINNSSLQNYLTRKPYNTDIKKLTNIEHTFIDLLTEGELTEYTVLSLKNHQLNVEEYINEKYKSLYGTLDESKWKILEESKNDSDSNIILDYCKVTMGKASLLKIIPQYFIYKHMFENLANQRTNLRDVEFVINVKDTPIVKYDIDHKILLSPDIFEMQLVGIKSELLPILSSKYNLLNLWFYKNLMKFIILNILSFINKKKISINKLKTNNLFFGIINSGHMNKDYINLIKKRNLSNKNIQILLHPNIAKKSEQKESPQQEENRDQEEGHAQEDSQKIPLSRRQAPRRHAQRSDSRHRAVQSDTRRRLYGRRANRAFSRHPEFLEERIDVRSGPNGSPYAGRSCQFPGPK